MRLGLSLLGSHISRYVMPYRFRGKYRKVKDPAIKDLFKMKQDFEREEQNMLILRHPYLTIEQANGYTGYTRSDRAKEFYTKIQEEKFKKFEKETTIAERLCHLRVTEAWD